MESGGRAGATQAAGFEPVGGRCSRMGRDRAVLRAGLRTLEADSVRQAAGDVALIGDAEKHAPLRRPVLADALESGGPTGGIYTAPLPSKEHWSLVVARDLPGPDSPGALMEGVARSPQGCLVWDGPIGMQPRRAVFHRRLLLAPESALKQKAAENERLFAPTEPWPVADASAIRNIQTPEQRRREAA